MSAEYIVIPFESEIVLYRDDFTGGDIGKSWCGSLEPCTMHQRGGKSTCLRVGNHAMWGIGCSYRWISREFKVTELANEAVGLEVEDVQDFKITYITFGVLLECGFGASVFNASAELSVLVNDTVWKSVDIPIPPPNQDKGFKATIGLTLGRDDTVRIRVDENLRALSGYPLLHVHDIVVHYKGKALVPSSTVKKGDLEIAVLDEEGNPVYGALVEIHGPVHKSGRTGVDGYIVFENIPYGRYRVIVRKSGYKAADVYVTLNDVSVTAKIVLEKVKGGGIPLTVMDTLKIIGVVAGVIGAGAAVYSLITRKRR